MSDIGYNDSAIINVPNTLTGLAMLDKLSGVKDDRRVRPLDAYDNIIYPHRYLYSTYNLQIGDTYFMIPPEFIMVNSQATSQSIVTLRQENSIKEKSGYHKRIILIDLVFCGLDQINGFKVEGPEGYYYVDGLRQLLAQFKLTPFLPISNELINGTYGIFTVVLQSITMSTVSGFPNMMKAQITLQEVNMFPYIEVPDVYLKYMIDWDLFRFYYQRILTEKHVYKKLQSLPANKEHNHFKISILDEGVFSNEDIGEDNFLEVLCDDDNYITWVDSNESDCVITEFQCGYTNLLTNVQMSDASTPTVQFMGGMDTIFGISFETTDYTVVQSLEQCQVSNDAMTRNNAKFRSLGFVKLESELVEFTGSLFVVIESLTTTTIPGFPGLFRVQIQCVAYDIAQSERENLNGFMPFPLDKGENHIYGEQAISQTKSGLKTKIKQDAYAEWKLRNTMEVYPDLRLPTYAEVNKFIVKCAAFRESHNLTPLNYHLYPTNPVCMLHGNSIDNNVRVPLTKGIGYCSDISKSTMEYEGYVDPDFYVFYPDSYLSYELETLQEDGESFYDLYETKQKSSYTKTKVETSEPLNDETDDNSTDLTGSNMTLIEEFIAVLSAQLGNSYKLDNKADGRLKDANGKLVFDCSGYVTYGLRQIGAMSQSSPRLVVSDIPGRTDLFTEMDWDSRQRGDCLVKGDLSHVVVYIGNNRVIHAANSRDGVKESNQYFVDGRCFRPKVFMQTTSTSSTSSSSSSSGAASVWNILKSYGLSDYACAGILGNMQAESGVNSYAVQGNYTKSNPTEYNETYVSNVDSGVISRNQFVHNGPGGGGFGLVQFTYYAYKEQLYDMAKAQNKSIADEGLQVQVFINQIKQSGVFSQLMSASSVQEASNIMLLKYERPANQGASVQSKRASYSQAMYNTYAGTTGSSGTGTVVSNENVLTTEEFESICRIVQAECNGEKTNTYKPIAQVIYDRLTSLKYGGLGNILNDRDQFAEPITGTIDEAVEKAVRQVFCDNNKYWSNYTAYAFLTPDSNISTFKLNDLNYDRLGEIGSFTFWGKQTEGSTIQYVISDTDGTSSASNNSTTITYSISHEAYETNAENFAEPVLVKLDKMMDSGSSDFAKNTLNSGLNIYNTSFVNERQYSHRGRLVKAFPTYLFCILDDQAQWYDGRKLWTNYYTHKAAIDINVHATNDMPTETATIVINNTYHNLDRTPGGLSQYRIADDDEYGWFAQTWYKWTGMLPGFGPKLTSKLIELHQIIYNHALLREGARVHLRMGYGSDPMGLAPMLNGFISDVQLGDQISIVATSDGVEFIQHITSSNEKDTNNGWFGLFGLGEEQESSDIITGILCKRQSWVNYLVGSTFEGSKYSIEHFGLYFGDTKIWIDDIYNGYSEQYDICKNIYKANYKREHFVYAAFLDVDDEDNVVFNKYNMTPWDVFQICVQNVPEYIVKPSYHQFDSRLYFGLPFWMEKYRYDYLNGTIYEECKSSTQVHLLESLTNIIDDRVKVTSRYTNTNVKVMYTRGSSSVSTKVIHSDDTIDYAKQKTGIIDSSITQDALGPDAIYEFLGYDIGKKSARRIGISNLLYGWQQEYQGQLLCFGLPGINAHDYIMIDDMYSNLFGIALVREVIHSFNTNTGFTTSVTPGMIGFCTDENSGLIETCENWLNLLNNFSSYLTTRRVIKNNYEMNLNVFANFEIMRDQVMSFRTYTEKLEDIQTGYAIGHTVISGLDLTATVLVARNLYKLHKAGKILSTFKDGYRAFMGAAKVAKGIKNAVNIYKGINAGIKAVSVAAAGGTFGISLVIGLVVSTVIDILVGEIIDWFSNKNVCVLLPLWWEGYPFVAGVKDGEKILLIDSNANATEENTRQDSRTEVEDL